MSLPELISVNFLYRKFSLGILVYTGIVKARKKTIMFSRLVISKFLLHNRPCYLRIVFWDQMNEKQNRKQTINHDITQSKNSMSQLFSPLSIKSVTLKNRI